MLGRLAGSVLNRIRNRVVNNIGSGAVAGSPGTSPTHMQVLGTTGLTRTISKGVTVLGEEYVDFSFAGTTGDGNGIQIDMAAANTTIPTSTGWDETFSVGLALVAGSIANIANITLGHRYGDVAGTLIASVSGSDIKSLLTAAVQRFSYYRRVDSAATRFIKPRIQVAMANGAAVDFTLRIVLPQLEKSSRAGRVTRKPGN